MEVHAFTFHFVHTGFTIEDLLPPDIDLNMPPRIPSNRPMTEQEVFITMFIASVRYVLNKKFAMYWYKLAHGDRSCNPLLEDTIFNTIKIFYN